MTSLSESRIKFFYFFLKIFHKTLMNTSNFSNRATFNFDNVVFMFFITFFGSSLFIVYQLFSDIKEANALVVEKINRNQVEVILKTSQVASQGTEVGIASNLALGAALFIGFFFVCLLMSNVAESAAVTNAIVEKALPQCLNIQTNTISTVVTQQVESITFPVQGNFEILHMEISKLISVICRKETIINLAQQSQTFNEATSPISSFLGLTFT